MLINVIREYNKAAPFVPYEIRTTSGQVLKVPHPDFVFVAPRGSFVLVMDEKDRPRNISSILIEEVSQIPEKSSRRSKK